MVELRQLTRTVIHWLSWGFTSQPTQNRSFRRHSSQPLSWLCTEKLKQTQQSKHKARFGRLLRPPACTWSGPILVSAHKFVTYLLTYSATYPLNYSPGTHTGHTNYSIVIDNLSRTTPATRAVSVVTNPQINSFLGSELLCKRTGQYASIGGRWCSRGWSGCGWGRCRWCWLRGGGRGRRSSSSGGRWQLIVCKHFNVIFRLDDDTKCLTNTHDVSSTGGWTSMSQRGHDWLRHLDNLLWPWPLTSRT